MDAQIAERFGWTFSQLDEEDEGEVMRAVQMMNLAAAYQSVLDAVRRHKPEAVPDSYWHAYRTLRDATDDS